jgi:hypothetical protein
MWTAEIFEKYSSVQHSCNRIRKNVRGIVIRKNVRGIIPHLKSNQKRPLDSFPHRIQLKLNYTPRLAVAQTLNELNICLHGFTVIDFDKIVDQICYSTDNGGINHAFSKFLDVSCVVLRRRPGGDTRADERQLGCSAPNAIYRIANRQQDSLAREHTYGTHTVVSSFSLSISPLFLFFSQAREFKF